MKSTDLEWTIIGRNKKGQKCIMSIRPEEVQAMIDKRYETAPNEWGLCETCKHFDKCIDKIVEEGCVEYKENKTLCK